MVLDRFDHPKNGIRPRHSARPRSQHPPTLLKMASGSRLRSRSGMSDCLCVPNIRFSMDAENRRVSCDRMKDLFRLILGVLTLLFKSRAKLEAEILILRQRSMCFAGGHRNDGTLTIPIVFCCCLVPLRPWRDCDCQAGDHHSLAPRWVSSWPGDRATLLADRRSRLSCARSLARRARRIRTAGLTLHHRAVHATLLSLAGHHRTIHHHAALGKSSRSTADFPTAGWNASAQQPARDFGPDLG